jgi:leader peptidase (prepilin peptidase)/N-methyltransferase
MAILFCLAFFLNDLVWLPAVVLAASFFFLLIASVIDLRTKMIPVEYVLVAGFFGGISQITQGVSIMSILLGILVGAGALAAVRLLWFLAMKEEGMGEGDLWLGGALGAVTAYPLVIVVLIGAVLIGAVIGILVTLLRKTTLQYALPFGPFLFLGALIALLWGESLIHWYTTLSGIGLIL